MNDEGCWIVKTLIAFSLHYFNAHLVLLLNFIALAQRIDANIIHLHACPRRWHNPANRESCPHQWIMPPSMPRLKRLDFSFRINFSPQAFYKFLENELNYTLIQMSTMFSMCIAWSLNECLHQTPMLVGYSLMGVYTHDCYATLSDSTDDVDEIS